MKKLTRNDIAFNSTKGVPMQNMNTAPTAAMKEMGVSQTAGHVQRKAGSSWKGKSSWT